MELLERGDFGGSQRPKPSALTNSPGKAVIAALNETRFAGEVELSKKGAGDTFFVSGQRLEARGPVGISFAIKSNLIEKMTEHERSSDDTKTGIYPRTKVCDYCQCLHLHYNQPRRVSSSMKT
ncbi:endonuclease/exonuclease/phosphatase family [Plakobranchus ocellatus]|uniref:Endonuclease/exonuclease/phosphatase family n=1 Tax=Plakobranchus ocellatus TaxID=259542 RepID=A0AAV4DSR7_9GAST|nr:endonuclease/exonuclease/phosphatase family [Plakobranchus ocellatus]